MKYVIILLMVWQAAPQLRGQQDLLMEMAMEHFGKPDPKSVWWLKDLKGNFDQTHEIRMVLATDNTLFKGAYEILSSKEKFYLDGNYDGEQIVLVESDSLGRTTGVIRGDMNEDVLYAEWSDPKNTVQLPVYVAAEGTSPYPCGNIGWAHYLSVKGPDSLKKISVLKYEDRVELQLFYPASSVSHEMECLDDECRLLSHTPQNLEDQSQYQLDTDKNTLIGITDTKETLYQLKSIKSIYFDCSTYMDFDEKFSLVYPISASQKFNTWIVKEWVEKYGVARHHKRQQGNFSVSERLSHEEYGSFQLDFFNDKILSGLFTIQSSKYAQATEIPITYWFEKERTIVLQDLFLPGIDALAVIQDQVAMIKKMRQDNDEFTTFSAADYQYITCNSSGLLCRTTFSTVYGQDTILLPVEDIRKYLRKNAMPIW